MGAEEFHQKFCLHISPIPNSFRPQRVGPDFSLVLQSQIEELKPHQIHFGDVLFIGIAHFLELPDMGIGIFTLHSMENREQGHYIGLNNDVLWKRHNARG